MYDDELAFTGIGGVALGGMVFDAVWLAALAFLVIGAGLLLSRVMTPKDS
jgi:hypothetical protein